MVEQQIESRAKRIQRLSEPLIFLVIWPALNVILIATVLFYTNHLTFKVFGIATAKLLSVFLISYLLGKLLGKLLFTKLSPTQTHYLWLIQPSILMAMFLISAPLVTLPTQSSKPIIMVFPTIVMLLQTVIYVGFTIIIKQQARFYLSKLQTQNAELQMLKMQSNPHFLFNTLNLIASEITQDPTKAQELIYDLSDLLRNTVKLSQQQWCAITEELKLAELYLLLQKNRFNDRLTFDIDCPKELNQQKVPSLFLLPVVENAVKHGVAPYSQAGHISIDVSTSNNKLVFLVHDTGQSKSVNEITYGDGLRILEQTLSLHYAKSYLMELSTCPDGNTMTICIPLAKAPTEQTK